MVTEVLQSRSKKVCVIGAGPSGLVSARELRKEGHKVVVLEQNGDVGGQWLYQPNVEEEEPLGPPPGEVLKVHSSVYSSLRLISPRETMGYSDFPFVVKKGRDTRRFPGHNELLLYLKDFCECFGLRDMIRFNERVEYVGIVKESVNGGLVLDDEDMKWVVRSKEKGSSGKVVEEVYDAVVVATGHYSYPRLPSIQGMDSWKGKQIHSHVYRKPDQFRDEVVVLVGNSNSGQDLSMELAEVAKQVHLSVKYPDLITPGLSKVVSKYQNLHLQPQIESLQDGGEIIFVDGSRIKADTILYCTGYSYKFPFLDTEGRLGVDDDRVGPLFEHTFIPSLAPSLSFVGIPRKLIGFPFFEAQAMWIAQVLSGKRTLPSTQEMMKAAAEFYAARDAAGIPKYNTHDICDFMYCDRYGDYVGYPHLEEWRKELTLSALYNCVENLETYRDSWDDDNLLQQALQSSHFTQLLPSSLIS